MPSSRQLTVRVQPIRVRPVPSKDGGGQGQSSAVERRVLAAKIAELERIPALVPLERRLGDRPSSEKQGFRPQEDGVPTMVVLVVLEPEVLRFLDNRAARETVAMLISGVGEHWNRKQR